MAFVIVLALVGGGCMVFCLYLMFVCFCWSFSCLVGFGLLFVCVGCLIWCLLYIWLVGYFLWWVACCCCFAFSVIARCWLVYVFVVGVVVNSVVYIFYLVVGFVLLFVMLLY